MYGDQPLNFTLIAGVATPQYRVVQASGQDYGGLATATTQVLLGIAQNSAAAGEHISVCALGESRCYVNSAITAYDYLTATASGGVATAVSGDNIIGRAMETGAIGDIVRVFVNATGFQKGAL
jgi:hypothetical protein